MYLFDPPIVKELFTNGYFTITLDSKILMHSISALILSMECPISANFEELLKSSPGACISRSSSSSSPFKSSVSELIFISATVSSNVMNAVGLSDPFLVVPGSP
jgi:hypothetical protein